MAALFSQSIVALLLQEVKGDCLFIVTTANKWWLHHEWLKACCSKEAAYRVPCWSITLFVVSCLTPIEVTNFTELLHEWLVFILTSLDVRWITNSGLHTNTHTHSHTYRLPGITRYSPSQCNDIIVVILTFSIILRCFNFLQDHYCPYAF